MAEIEPTVVANTSILPKLNDRLAFLQLVSDPSYPQAIQARFSDVAVEIDWPMPRPRPHFESAFYVQTDEKQVLEDLFSLSSEYSLQAVLLYGSLVLENGEKHRRDKIALLHAGFSIKSFPEYLTYMQYALQTTLEGWKGKDVVNIGFEVRNAMFLFAASFVFGLDSKQDRQEIEFLRKQWEQFANGFLDPIQKKWIPILPFRKAIRARENIEQFIHTRIDLYREGKVKKNSILKEVIGEVDNQEVEFTNDDIVNHLIFLMYAAYDTTSVTLPKLLMLVRSNKAVYTQLQEQAESMDMVGIVHQAYPLMNASIQEGLRLYPPIPFIPRRLGKDYILPGKNGKRYCLPAGGIVLIGIGGIQRSEAFFAHANTFDPYRKELVEKSDLLNSFGKMAHACLGGPLAERVIALVLFEILKKYDIDFLEESKRHKPGFVKQIILRLKDAGWFTLFPLPLPNIYDTRMHISRRYEEG